MSGVVDSEKSYPPTYDPDARLSADHAAVEFIARFILETEPRTYLSSLDIERRLDIDRQRGGQIIGELRDSDTSPLVVTDERSGAKCRKKYRIEFSDPESEP